MANLDLNWSYYQSESETLKKTSISKGFKLFILFLMFKKKGKKQLSKCNP